MKVLIVDDEQPARERLRQILDDEPDYEVIGEAANGHEALEVASHTHPDIVLLDIRMPGMEGIEAAHHLNEMDPPPAVVFTTAYDALFLQGGLRGGGRALVHAGASGVGTAADWRPRGSPRCPGTATKIPIMITLGSKNTSTY